MKVYLAILLFLVATIMFVRLNSNICLGCQNGNSQTINNTLNSASNPPNRLQLISKRFLGQSNGNQSSFNAPATLNRSTASNASSPIMQRSDPVIQNQETTLNRSLGSSLSRMVNRLPLRNLGGNLDSNLGGNLSSGSNQDISAQASNTSDSQQPLRRMSDLSNEGEGLNSQTFVDSNSTTQLRSLGNGQSVIGLQARAQSAVNTNQATQIRQLPGTLGNRSGVANSLPETNASQTNTIRAISPSVNTAEIVTTEAVEENNLPAITDLATEGLTEEATQSSASGLNRDTSANNTNIPNTPEDTDSNSQEGAVHNFSTNEVKIPLMVPEKTVVEEVKPVETPTVETITPKVETPKLLDALPIPEQTEPEVLEVESVEDTQAVIAETEIVESTDTSQLTSETVLETEIEEPESTVDAEETVVPAVESETTTETSNSLTTTPTTLPVLAEPLEVVEESVVSEPVSVDAVEEPIVNSIDTTNTEETPETESNEASSTTEESVVTEVEGSDTELSEPVIPESEVVESEVIEAAVLEAETVEPVITETSETETSETEPSETETSETETSETETSESETSETEINTESNSSSLLAPLLPAVDTSATEVDVTTETEVTSESTSEEVNEQTDVASEPTAEASEEVANEVVEETVVEEVLEALETTEEETATEETVETATLTETSSEETTNEVVEETVIEESVETSETIQEETTAEEVVETSESTETSGEGENSGITLPNLGGVLPTENITPLTPDPSTKPEESTESEPTESGPAELEPTESELTEGEPQETEPIELTAPIPSEIPEVVIEKIDLKDIAVDSEVEYWDAYFAKNAKSFEDLVTESEEQETPLLIVDAMQGESGIACSLENPCSLITAMGQVKTGGTILIREGDYALRQRINITRSGTEDSPIVIRNYPEEDVLISGEKLSGSSADAGLINISNQQYIRIQGLELANYSSSKSFGTVAAIMLRRSASNIEIIQNHIHDIKTLAPKDNTSALGIAIYGTSPSKPMRDILIQGNHVHDLTLGFSESISLSGNVDGFRIEGNQVHDVDNIGIVVAGGYGTACWESANSNNCDDSFDYARNGLIMGNTVYNVDTRKNSAYSDNTVNAAAGIYVDGARDIIVERNRVYSCGSGLSVSSENAGGLAKNIIVRNNLIYNNFRTGLNLGAENDKKGRVDNATITNNTFYNNDLSPQWGGEIYMEYDVDNSLIANNIFYADNFIYDAGNEVDLDINLIINDGLPEEVSGSENNKLVRNIYHGKGVNRTWQWQGKWYNHESFEAFLEASGDKLDEAEGSFDADPGFAFLPDTPDDEVGLIRLEPSLINPPSRNRAFPLSASIVGDLDKAANPRLNDDALDIGAYEH